MKVVNKIQEASWVGIFCKCVYPQHLKIFFIWSSKWPSRVGNFKSLQKCSKFFTKKKIRKRILIQIFESILVMTKYRLKIEHTATRLRNENSIVRTLMHDNKANPICTAIRPSSKILQVSLHPNKATLKILNVWYSLIIRPIKERFALQ